MQTQSGVQSGANTLYLNKDIVETSERSDSALPLARFCRQMKSLAELLDNVLCLLLLYQGEPTASRCSVRGEPFR